MLYYVGVPSPVKTDSLHARPPAVLLSPPLGLEQLFDEYQLDLVLHACSRARPISRVNSCRQRKTKYWVDLAVLSQVHSDIALFLNQKFDLTLKPVSNCYYIVDEDGTFPPRTLRIGYGISLVVLLKATDEASDWAFLSTHAFDDDVRNSSLFVGGINCHISSDTEHLSDVSSYVFPLTPGDAVLFSGSHCVHSFDGPCPDERHIAMFHFNAEGVHA